MPNVSLPSWGILRNQLHPAKVLNSDFYLCPPSKSHVPNYLIDSKYFLIHKFQGIRHNKSNNGGHIFWYGRWFPRTRSFWDTQWYHVDSKVLSSWCCCFLSHTSFNGCGMGPLLVLVSHCFRENVVVRLCSLDNLLQKNVIVFFFGNHISKWRSFEEKKGLFWPTFHNFLVTREKLQKKKKKIKDISHSHTHMCFAHPIEFFILPYQFWKKNTNLSGMVSLWYDSWCWFLFTPFWNNQQITKWWAITLMPNL